MSSSLQYAPTENRPGQAGPRGAPGRSLQDLCAASELDADAQALAAGVPGARELITALTERERPADAVRLLAHLLPRREGVWWAWVCARKATGDAPGTPAAVRAALDATERWIVQPTEENRRAAMRFAEQATFGTPAGCAALAAFFSSGSIAPPEAPPVPPGEFMSCKAVAGAVTLAAVSDPPRAKEHFQAYLALGLEAAQRLGLAQHST